MQLLPLTTRLPQLGRLCAFMGLALLLARPNALVGDPGLVVAAPLLMESGPVDPPSPIVKIKVRVPACALPGKPIEYHLCIENCSTAEAHHVVVKNPLPANAKFVRSDPEPARQLPELQWHLGTIGGMASRTIVLSLQPTNQEEVKNCTRVQFEHGQCVVTRPSAYFGPLPPDAFPPGTLPPGTEPPGVERGRAPGSEKKGANVRPVPPIVSTEDLPKLTLAMQGHKQQYINLPSRYFMTVSNESKSRATNVLITAALPEKAEFLHASDQGQFLERQAAWFLGNLDPGQKRTVELLLKASAAGEWCVKTTVRADRNMNETAESCTQFLGASALTVYLADREDPLIVGGKTSYPIMVHNQGRAAVTNLRVRVLVPPSLQLVRTLPAEFQKEKQGPEGEWLVLPAVARLEPGERSNFEVFVEARRIGASRLEVQVFADQLERGPVIEQENTTIFDDERTPKAAP